MRRAGTMASALIASCHPVPSVAVTVFLTALAASVGNSVATCVTVAVAVLAGQLSIGWCNDRLDVALDQSAGREDKPLARYAVDLRAVDIAIAVALCVTVVGSLALGWLAGLIHLIAVAFGWLYNLGLKATWLSGLPYAVAFGAAPGIATFAVPGHPAPAAWAVLAGALLGTGAHLTNALPDLAADKRFGVVGLPHWLGARRSLAVATVALSAATAVLVFAPTASPSALRWIGLVVALLCGAAGSVLAWLGHGTRWAFYGTIVIAAVDVALLMAGPTFTA